MVEKIDDVLKGHEFRMIDWTQFRAGLVACVPTLLGYWAVGFACGTIGNVSGFSLAEIACMSIFVYASSAQFFTQSTTFEKLVGGLLMTDETFGVAERFAKKNDGRLPFSWLLGLNLLAWGSWTFATLMGCLFADFLPDWLRESFGFSLVGMFFGAFGVKFL